MVRLGHLSLSLGWKLGPVCIFMDQSWGFRTLFLIYFTCLITSLNSSQCWQLLLRSFGSSSEFLFLHLYGAWGMLYRHHLN